MKLLLLTILVKGSYLNLRASLQYWDIIISLISATACKFMQSRHTDWYLQPKQLPITASAKQPRTSLVIIMVIRNNFENRFLPKNYEPQYWRTCHLLHLAS